MASEHNRFPQQQQQQQAAPRRKRWRGCLGGLSCFGAQKGGKRIVPASRIPEGNSMANVPNGAQNVGLPNQTAAVVPSLLAPPSSPASFTNSALPSTAQSPSNYLSLSANSPEGPSNTMFATGPYAHETQLVSPPVFSTFTTEPSTAPFTPPPELAHLTTPSSPDVPFAQFLSSSMNLRGTERGNYISTNDLQATYSLYPGSPASSLRSPVSRISGDCLSSSLSDRGFNSQWDPSVSSHSPKYPRSELGKFEELETATASKLAQDSNFFCPATFAQFYLDQPPNSGGRLSISRESDVYSNGGSGHQNRQSKPSKQDVDEIEAYRASFGFSADEVITTAHYVEISDVMDESFSMTNLHGSVSPPPTNRGQKAEETQPNHSSQPQNGEVAASGNGSWRQQQQGDGSARSTPGNNHNISSDEEMFSRLGPLQTSRKYLQGSCSDAEIDYRRCRSLREGIREFAGHDRSSSSKQKKML